MTDVREKLAKKTIWNSKRRSLVGLTRLGRINQVLATKRGLHNKVEVLLILILLMLVYSP